MLLYFFPFLVSFILSISAIAFFLYAKKRVSFLQENRKEAGREEKKEISRWGGCIAGGVFLGTLLADPSLVLTWDIWGLLVGCLGMFLMGMWDDIRALGWRWQLFFQVGAVLLVIAFFGVHIPDLPNPFGERIFFEGGWGMVLGGFVTLLWFLLLMNALNWIDGVDGVAPGTVVLSAIAFFVLSLRPEVFQPPVAIIALSLLGSYLGLFLFNMHPAKIFSGTAGVYVAGFAIAYLSIFAGAKIATVFLVLGIPILDALWVLFRRYCSGSSFTHPDKKHIHHTLLSSGWSEKKVGFFLLGSIALSTSATFVFGMTGKVSAFCILLVVFGIFVHKRNGE